MPRLPLKLLAAVGLVAAADIFFVDLKIGSTLGLFALLWALVLILTVPAVRHGRAARTAAVAAIGFALILTDDPSLLGWVLFWTALSLAALLPRRRFDDALNWAARLVLHGPTMLVALPDEVRSMRRAGSRGSRFSLSAALRLLLPPVVGTIIFLWLFAAANPVIDQALDAVRLPWLHPVRIAFWAFVFGAVWMSLRPRPFVTRMLRAADEEGPETPPSRFLPRFTPQSIVLSLVVFNLVFAVQNLLDILFLWSGARLPQGMTLADYAHRGAYPLIVTALLAGLFVLVALRPGSDTAARPLVRWLVVAWVGQNIFLVASSILRTIDYIDAYSLTVLRISALLWMALVATGLALICWRLLRGRSARWLINANALAAALVLATASAVDLGSVAAAWNTRHAREVDGSGAELDLCYLRGLGPSALVSLARLEVATADPRLRDRIASVRYEHMDRLAYWQSDWRNWTWRGQRRLAAAQAVLGPNPRGPVDAKYGRDCEGFPYEPPPPPPPDPLTQAPQQ
ncbi:MAG: DUF4173 domain-containing protein [Allosphingosinicella sp.]|uniref:DUF4153 domain-containing protein n=1 Tax=Allosphingosinicella sp. TaxID=2823234 RepID=UPI00392231A7